MIVPKYEEFKSQRDLNAMGVTKQACALIDKHRSSVHHHAHICTGGLVPDTTFTELRNRAKYFFDVVEGGESVRVFRNGKPIAEIVPIRSGVPSWKRQTTPLTIKGFSLSREILSDRDKSA